MHMLCKSIFVMTTVLCVQASAMRPGSEEFNDGRTQPSTISSSSSTTTPGAPSTEKNVMKPGSDEFTECILTQASTEVSSSSTRGPNRPPFMIEMPDGSYLVGKAAIAYDMFINVPRILRIGEPTCMTIPPLLFQPTTRYNDHPSFILVSKIEDAALQHAIAAEILKQNARKPSSATFGNSATSNLSTSDSVGKYPDRKTSATSGDTSTASTSTTNSKDSNISAASGSAAGGRDSVEGGNISASKKGKSDPFAFCSDEFQ